MKKYLPFLIAGMLLFCGIEAVTSTIDNNESQSENIAQQPEFMLDVKGGIGLSFILTNTGNETFKGYISGGINIKDCFVFLGGSKPIDSTYYEINFSKGITIKHFFIGLGSAIVTSEFNIENVSLIESEANFFIFLMFAIPYK
jgi:hypothetical protein